MELVEDLSKKVEVSKPCPGESASGREVGSTFKIEKSLSFLLFTFYFLISTYYFQHLISIQFTILDYTATSAVGSLEQR
jgi:hypothetical protein